MSVLDIPALHSRVIPPAIKWSARLCQPPSPSSVQDWTEKIIEVQRPGRTHIAKMWIHTNPLGCLQTLLDRCQGMQLQFTPKPQFKDGTRIFTSSVASGTWMEEKWVSPSDIVTSELSCKHNLSGLH